MKFIVETPIYFSMGIEAPDAATAAKAAEEFIAEMAPVTSRFDYKRGKARITTNQIVTLDEDATPDIYVCRSGDLKQLTPSGTELSVGEACS